MSNRKKEDRTNETIGVKKPGQGQRLGYDSIQRGENLSSERKIYPVKEILLN